MTLDLSYRPAPPHLRPFALGVIERRDEAQGEAALELPVHHTLLQFMLGADYRVADPTTAAAPETAPRAGLWGPAGRTRIGRADGRLHVFVVILTARGARAVSRACLAELVDRRLALDEVLPVSGRHWAGRIAAAADFETRSALALRWLEEAISAEPSPASACGLVDDIADHRLRGSVGALARRAGVGPRALHQRFVDQVGWPPKTWLRLARLQRVLRAIHPGAWGGADPGDVHLEFTDEAHLAHDFADLTGVSAAAYRRAKRETGDPLLHTLLRPLPVGG